MTVIAASRNAEDLSMTLVAEFAAAPERVWGLWQDPRKLERWWGPPGYPATFTRYEFAPGGQCRYRMTGPDDFVHHGWWRIEALDAPRRIELVQGLSGDGGEPIPNLEPMRGVVTIEPTDAGARMTVQVTFADAEQMERLALGMQEAMSLAVGQLDALLRNAPGLVA
jgi:uncharacterized protein YndB with AHSA1/START domain